MQKNLWAIVLGVAGLAVALALLPSRQSVTLAESNHASAAPKTATVRGAETVTIVPADVLGTGVVSWAPLTGDGSN